MILIIGSACSTFRLNNNDTFYRIGPHDDLIVLGIAIDTMYKYILIVIYSLLNTCIRNINRNIISPWITVVIQNNSDDSKHLKSQMNKSHIYEISIISTIYTWFDWLIYLNMLLSQFDFVIIELLTDMISSSVITYSYL
jgi:hypothetical protein